MKKEIKHAISGKNGITIYSNLLPMYGVETYYDENDKIRFKPTKGYPSKMYFEALEPALKVRDLTMFSFFITVMIAMLSIAFSKYALLGAISYALVTALYADYVVLIVWFIEHKVKKGSGRNVGRFHSAEHMAINAYERYQRVPSIEEIKKETRFSKYCGSMLTFNAIFYKTISAIGVFCFIHFTAKIMRYMIDVKGVFDIFNFFILILMIIGLGMLIYCSLVFISAFVEKMELLKYLQVFVTSDPTDREILLAQQAVENFVILEHELKKTIVFASFDINDYF